MSDQDDIQRGGHVTRLSLEELTNHGYGEDQRPGTRLVLDGHEYLAGSWDDDVDGLRVQYLGPASSR